ncbi:hypothetical protein ABZY83_36610, partial [Streptomyces virginiae]|uniref:hypothetical protein n=1 Tax=Streptomyces virginiae TaxID=1961 RepID=UPI0033B73263
GDKIINSYSGLLTTVGYQIGDQKPVYARPTPSRTPRVRRRHPADEDRPCSHTPVTTSPLRPSS